MTLPYRRILFLRRRIEHSQETCTLIFPGVNCSWPQNARIERIVSSLLVFNSSPSAIHCFAPDEHHLAKQGFGIGGKE
jgi:hypothetical protein